VRFGAFLRGAFGLPKPEAAAALARVKDWARSASGASPDTAFAVNEIACTDPGCPGVETVILVMAPGARTRALKIQKPLEAVTEQDVATAFES
jgi:hypothetical protein